MDVFETILGSHRRKAALVLALAMLLAVPIGALLTPDEGGSQASPRDAETAGELSSMEEAPPANLDLVRKSLQEAAQRQGVDYEPVQPPEPAEARPLHAALDEWLQTQYDEVPEQTRSEAHDQAREVPVELREPLARLLLAHAEATLLQEEALEPLSEHERRQIQALGDDRTALATTLEDPPAWLEHAATKVDLARSFQAAHLLVDAADRSVPELRDHTDELARTGDAATSTAKAEEGTPALLQAVQDAPARELADLDDLLEALAGPRPSIQPTTAAPLSDQLADLGAEDGQAPAPVEELPASLDSALGQLWLASTASSHVLASQGPDALVEAHLLRVRAMQETAPTLDAWGKALDNPSLDTRHLARPSLAAGKALDRSAGLPAPDAGLPQLLGYALETPQPRPTSPQASGPVDALGSLYDASDAEPPPGWRQDARATLTALDADQREGLTLLLQGLTQARVQAADAVSSLEADERQHLADNQQVLASFLAGERLDDDKLDDAHTALEIAQQIDRPALASAAVTSATSIERARDLLQPSQASGHGGPHAPGSCPEGAPLSDCSQGLLFQDPVGLVVVGTAGDTTHSEPVDAAPILLLDLGGNDTYRAPVADSNLFRPLSVGLDLGGEDRFTSEATGQGRGLAGVGLLVQTGGDTDYRVGQRGQGYGAVGGGIGALIDLGGEDTYSAQALAQAASSPFGYGTGTLIDTNGGDRYASARGIGYAAGATFLDLGGHDTYEVAEPGHGARLDQGVDLDDVPDRVFQDRRDNALWLDGSATTDAGHGLDVDADRLDHDDDLFPTLVEILADSRADNSAETPITKAEEAAGTGEDSDGDGSPNAVEEAAGTDPDDGDEGAASPPTRVPMAPEEAQQLYRQLRAEHTEAPPPNGLLLDIRMPLEDRAGAECAETLELCLGFRGPSDGTTSTDFDLDTTEGFPVGESTIIIGIRAGISTKTQAELGLVALGAPTNSTFELPYLLSVDLGGDDTYEQGAGGAVEIVNGYEQGAGGAVEIVNGDGNEEIQERGILATTHLDLGGDDTYLGEDLAQAAGGGVLADLGEGDDTYDGGASTQGARGGLLFDEAGDDRYRSTDASQGAALPTVGLSRSSPSIDDLRFSSFNEINQQLVRATEQAVEVAHEGSEATTLRPSLLVDGAGDDTREAGTHSQGYAGLTPGNTTLERESPGPQDQTVATNETYLLAGILDVTGDDTYQAGPRSQATASPNGLALLADREGDDTYRAGGLVSQAGLDTRKISGGTAEENRLPGLALLLDARGLDSYAVHPEEGVNRTRTEQREGNVTREQVSLGDGEATEVSARGVRLDAMQAVHADLEAAVDDRDGDGWLDALETVLGTDRGEDDSQPAGDTDPDGRLLDLSRAGLVVGGSGPNTYDRDAVLAVDLGGENTFANNAGGPILDPLALEPEARGNSITDSTVSSGKSSASAAPKDDPEPPAPTVFQHPVTAVFDVGAEGSTFQAPGDLAQGSSLFTVGLVLTGGGDNVFDASGEARDLAEAPEGPRASLDGLLGVKEYPHRRNVTWTPGIDPVRERSGELGLVHDGRHLYLGGSIPDDAVADDEPHPRVNVHLATMNGTPTLVDRLTLTPEDGGTILDQHREVSTHEWNEDDIDDETRTRARLDYVKGAWTFEIARPMEEPSRLAFEVEEDGTTALKLELCQSVRVLDSGQFSKTRLRDGGRDVILSDPVENNGDSDDANDELESEDKVEIELRSDEGQLAFERWHWLAGGESGGDVADEDCQTFASEDVHVVPGTLLQAFVTFEDPTTGETWRYPARGAAEDGEGALPADGSLDDELAAWLPVYPASLDPAPSLDTGPRLTQGASVAGVGLLASVSTGVGNDTYDAYRDAQGFGTTLGTGILADLGGPDTYRLDTQGQGHARDDAFGLVVDHHGNDRYEAGEAAQGHSPQAILDPPNQADLPNVDTLTGTQPRASFVDFGGYDHYDYDRPDAKRPVASLPVPASESYASQAGNDRVWRQGEAGVGVDTALASHGPRSILGDETTDVETEAWATDAEGECPRTRPGPGDRLDWHANHSIRLARERICLAVTAEDLILEDIPLRRIEVLLDGRREIVHDVREEPGEVERWPFSDDRTRFVFPINTTDIPDGKATWRAIAFYDAPRPADPAQEATWGPVPPVIAEDAVTLAVSNPPSVGDFEVRETVASPRPAVGEPGLPIEARLSPDLSGAELELSGYGTTREQIECPFDEEKTCDRHTLYLQDGRMEAHRPDDVVPTATTTTPSERDASTTYEHFLMDDLPIPGGEAMGVVEQDDSDLWHALEDAGVEQIAWDETNETVYAERTDLNQVSPGDVRLVEAGGRAPGTIVQPADVDVDPEDQTSLEPVQASVATRDGDWTSGQEDLYLDLGGLAADRAVRLVTPDVLQNHTIHNGTLVTGIDVPSLSPADGLLQPEAWNITTDDPGTVYVDVDDSTTVSPGDVRLGSNHPGPNASTELVYYSQPLYQGEVSVHASLATADADARERLVTNQTYPTFAETHARTAVDPVTTPAAGPDAERTEGFSHLWLPADETRVYPEAPNDPGVEHRLVLDVRTAFSEEPESATDCAQDQDDSSLGVSAPRGPCVGVALDGARPAPSRVHLYIPSRTEQALSINSTSLETGEEFSVETRLLGGEQRTVTWPVEDLAEGRYNLSLNAYDHPVNETPEDEEPVQRWAQPTHNETVRVDRTPPEADVALPDYVGTSLIDPLRRSFQIPWEVTDDSRIEELRVFAAPTSGPEPDDWERVERVQDTDRGGVDYQFDADHDTFSLSVVAMDEAGNIRGVDENLWPTEWPDGGRCPTPLPERVSVWPTGTEDFFPDLEQHCFQSRVAAVDAAFRLGLQRQALHTVTIDRSSPFLEDTDLGFPDREGQHEVHVDARTVPGIAAGEDVVPEACATDEGPAPIAEVRFFMLRKTAEGDTIENVHTLNETAEPDCYAFEDLGRWTEDEDRYPQGFWTAGFEVVDEAGNNAEAFLGTVYLDQHAPSLLDGGIQLPEGQRAVHRGQALTVETRAEDPTGVADATLSAPAFNTSEPIELTVDEGSIQGSLTVDRDVDPGVYDVYLNVTDALGNELVRHREVPVNLTPTEIVDGPRLTQLAPAGDDGTPLSTVPGGVGLSLETSTPSRFRVLAGTDPGALSTVYLHEGNFSTDHDVTIDTLSPGEVYLLEVVAFSEGGFEDRSDTLQVRAGPAFATEILQPSPGGVLGPDSRIAWNTTSAPNASVGGEVSTLVSLARSPNATFRPVGGQAHEFGPGHLDADLTGFPSGDRYALRIEAAAGGQRDVALVEPLTVDTAAPSVSLLQPRDGWTNTTQPTIELGLEDALGGLPADPVQQARLDGHPVSAHAAENGSLVSIPVPGSLEEGVHRLEMEVEDRVGNRDLATLPIYVDTSDPELRVTGAPDSAVRPGGDIEIEVFSRDEGTIDGVEAHLGSAQAAALTPGGLDELVVPVPDDVRPRDDLHVVVEDRAGNQATATRAISIDETPPRVENAEATADVASAHLNVSADEPVRLVATASGQLTVHPLQTDHSVTIDGLQPDARHDIQIRLTDAAGHTVHRSLTVHTQPDRSPPSPPGSVAVQPLADGSIAVDWDPADDDGGVAFYRLARSAAGEIGWRSLDRTSDTRFVDETVEPGTRYTYRVQAVDVASKTGDPATSPDVEPLATPELVDADVSPLEQGAETYRFEVTYSHPAGQAPDHVRLVLDGSSIAMDPVEGSTAVNTTYRTQVSLDPHTPTGSHTYRFEAQASDPPTTASLPEHGNFTGPLVSTLDDHDVSANPLPLPPAAALVALLAAAAVARLRPRRRS